MEHPLLVMLVVVAVITVLARIASFLGGLLQQLEKQARERMREREALEGRPTPATPEEQQVEAREELEQLFALLTGTRPPPRRRPHRPQPAPPARPPQPARPAAARTLAPAPERHGGDLATHHLRSEVQDEHLGHLSSGVGARHLGGTAIDRHLEPTLTTAEPTAQAGGTQAAEERAGRLLDRLEELPPVARGLLWGELLGPPLSRQGRRGRRAVRRV